MACSLKSERFARNKKKIYIFLVPVENQLYRFQTNLFLAWTASNFRSWKLAGNLAGMKSLKGDRGDNRLLPSCWFSKLVIEGENECLPLLYYHHWDALEQCSKPWLQLRAFLQKMAEFTAKLFRMNKSYARKQNHEVVSLTSSPFGMWHSTGRGNLGDILEHIGGIIIIKD